MIRKRGSGGSLWATTGQFLSSSCGAERRRARHALWPTAAGRAQSLKSRACYPTVNACWPLTRFTWVNRSSKIAAICSRCLLSSVGARPLGVQADQLQAVTRWATTQFGEPVERQVAIGPRISLAALIAAATGDDEERPQQLELHGSLGSLREIIENNWSVDEYPELFCFGLLQHCDIDDLIELAKPCEVVRK